MSSYKKYIMMGVSTVLLPIAAKLIQKLVGKFTGELRDDPTLEESDGSSPASEMPNRETNDA